MKKYVTFHDETSCFSYSWWIINWFFIMTEHFMMENELMFHHEKLKYDVSSWQILNVFFHHDVECIMKCWFIMKKIFEMKTKEVFILSVLSVFRRESLDSKVGMHSTSAVIQPKSFPETKLDRTNISTYKHKKTGWKRTNKQITYYGSAQTQINICVVWL